MAKTKKITASFTRPADTTTYTDQDLLANSTTAGSVTALSYHPGSVSDRILKVRVSKTSSNLIGANFVVNFYGENPTSLVGDNGPYNTTESDFMGAADVGFMSEFSNATTATVDLEIPIVFTTGRLFALLEADGAYQPASAETFTVDLWINSNGR